MRGEDGGDGGSGRGSGPLARSNEARSEALASLASVGPLELQLPLLSMLVPQTAPSSYLPPMIRMPAIMSSASTVLGSVGEDGQQQQQQLAASSVVVRKLSSQITRRATAAADAHLNASAIPPPRQYQQQKLHQQQQEQKVHRHHRRNSIRNNEHLPMPPILLPKHKMPHHATYYPHNPRHPHSPSKHYKRHHPHQHHLPQQQPVISLELQSILILDDMIQDAQHQIIAVPQQQQKQRMQGVDLRVAEDVEEEEEEEEEIEITAIHDLIAGGIAGSASVIVGQPFDTIKVRIQASTHTPPSSSSSLSSNYNVASIKSLFSGMLAPLCAAGIVNALVFSSYGYSSRLWDEHYPEEEECEEMLQARAEQDEMMNNTSDINTTATTTTTTNNNSIMSGFKWKNYWCGCFAGFVQTFVLCPTEHVKCRLQTQQQQQQSSSTPLSGTTTTNNNNNNNNQKAMSTTKSHHYKGPLDVAKHIYKTHGIKGIFRGWVATAWREIPAFGLYFSTYDVTKEFIMSKLSSSSTASSKNETHGGGGGGGDVIQTEEEDAPSWTASALAGGISGCITWTIVYPIDVIKTTIQTQSLTIQPSMVHATKYIIQNYGYRHLFRGLGITLLRAFPVNGIIFPVYEFTLLHLPGLMHDDANNSN